MILPEKILIIRPDRLGDLILSLPVAETLKKNLPDTEIQYLVSPYTAPIAPMVDYVEGWIIDKNPKSHGLPIMELAGRIRNGKFDCLIELKPSWRTSMAGYLSGVKTRIGTSRRFYSVFYSHRISVHRKSSGFHQTDLELAHLRLFDFKDIIFNPSLRATPRGLDEADALLKDVARSFVIIHPGSGGSAPNWPLEHYRRLAVLIRKKLDLEVVITNHEAGLEGFDGCLDLGGRTDVESLAGVISRSELFISGSTGPLHLADALGVRCVAIFSPRPEIGPVRWGPRKNMNNVVTPEIPCKCADLHNCDCLEKIPPDRVLEKISKLLTVSVPGAGER